MMKQKIKKNKTSNERSEKCALSFCFVFFFSLWRFSCFLFPRRCCGYQRERSRTEEFSVGLEKKQTKNKQKNKQTSCSGPFSFRICFRFILFSLLFFALFFIYILFFRFRPFRACFTCIISTIS